jgi:TolB-like protein/Tfp pilus assembly protein PilF
VSSRRDAVPAEVDRALATALATSRDDRFASAADFGRALATPATATTIQTPAGRTPPPARAHQSIAVLPFTNTSANPEDEYLSDGIAEEITNAVTKIEGLGVVSRTSAFAFKGKNVDIRKIGEQLNVKSVLEGSVRRAGNRLRITAQLVNVADGYHLWSERFDREMEDVFAIQDEIAEAIATTLKGRLAAEKHTETLKRYTDNVEAYQLYLKGRYVEKTRTRDGLSKGIQYFKRAIGHDANYALAYAGLADSHYLQAWYRYLSPHEAFPEARTAATKALEIDEQLPEAHTSQAVVKFYYDWDWIGAKQAFTRALEINPLDPTATHGYAEYLAALSRLDDASSMINGAHELDPLSLTINAGLGWIHYFCRRYDYAIEVFEKTLELDPDYVFINWFLGQAYLKNAMQDQAIATFRLGLARSGEHPGMAASLGHACAQAGRRTEALELHRGLEERAKQTYVPADYLSVICMGLGHTEDALTWLERACDERALHLVFLGVDPLFDDLRSDPRFAAVLQTLGLEQA